MRFLSMRLLATLPLILATFAALAACAPVTAFNTLTPKDPAVRISAGVPFGEGPRQKLDIYAPHGNLQNAPVIVFFYGGGWAEGRRQDYEFVARALASRGYLTLAADYRIFPEAVYPAFLEDGAAAVKWARDHASAYGGNPDKILLIGHSSGAYNAVDLALDTSFLKAAGVDPKIVRGVVGLAGPYDFLPLQVDATRNAFGDFADLPATQPINHARGDAPPILLIQGLDDTVVGPQNVDSLQKALSAVGAPVETRLYPGLNHADVVLALSRPFRGKAPILDEITAFFARVTR